MSSIVPNSEPTPITAETAFKPGTKVKVSDDYSKGTGVIKSFNLATPEVLYNYYLVIMSSGRGFWGESLDGSTLSFRPEHLSLLESELPSTVQPGSPSLSEMLESNQKLTQRFKPRKLTLTLAQIKKVLDKHGLVGNGMNVVLDDLCQAAKVETPRDILRAVKRSTRKSELDVTLVTPVSETPIAFKEGDRVLVRDPRWPEYDGEGIVTKPSDRVNFADYIEVKLTSGSQTGSECLFRKSHLKLI